MVRLGMSPKVLQIIMGHAKVQTTLNIYTHLSKTDVKKEMFRVLEIE